MALVALAFVPELATFTSTAITAQKSDVTGHEQVTEDPVPGIVAMPKHPPPELWLKFAWARLVAGEVGLVPVSDPTHTPNPMMLVDAFAVTAAVASVVSSAAVTAVPNGVVWSTPVNDSEAHSATDGALLNDTTTLFAPVAGAAIP